MDRHAKPGLVVMVLGKGALPFIALVALNYSAAWPVAMRGNIFPGLRVIQIRLL
jgi:hypothetical protein